MIHLGFGVEFEQPAVVAEALAQAAIHPGWCGPFLEQTAVRSRNHPVWTASDNLKDLFLELRGDSSITGAPCWNGHSFEKNGNFFADLPPNLVALAARYRLSPSMTPSEFHMRTAELLNVSAWITCTAQRDGKEAKLDFFLMHIVTSSIFFSVFEQQSWLSLESKIRLLECQARMILVIYACQGAPEPRVDLVESYIPRRPKTIIWGGMIEAAHSIPDDGHVLKVMRALNHGFLTCASNALLDQQIQSHFPFPLRSWLIAAHMVLDSTEDHPTTLGKWMRGPGWEESWHVVPDKK